MVRQAERRIPQKFEDVESAREIHWASLRGRGVVEGRLTKGTSK